jgi:hypothetical protein
VESVWHAAVWLQGGCNDAIRGSKGHHSGGGGSSAAAAAATNANATTQNNVVLGAF